MSRLGVVGGASPGYASLFTNSRVLSAPSNKVWSNVDAADQNFARRFGMARLYERNANLIHTLADPKGALEDVNAELYNIAVSKDQTYKKYLDQFRELGFGDEEAIARADILIGREIENELSLLQLRYPYAVGGAEAGGWDPVSAALMEDKSARNLPRTFKAIGSSGGLGVQGGARRRV